MSAASKARAVEEPGGQRPPKENEGGGDDRPAEPLADKTKRDQDAGDVADDLADFA